MAFKNDWRTPQMRTACARGYEAGLAGEPETQCPYHDVRTPGGHTTFSRAFRNAWIDGWEQGRVAREKQATASGDKKLES